MRSETLQSDMTSSLVQQDLCLLQISESTETICMGTIGHDHTRHRTVCEPPSLVLDDRNPANSARDATTTTNADHGGVDDVAVDDTGWLLGNTALVGGFRLPLATI